MRKKLAYYEYMSIGSESSSNGTCKDPVAQNYKGKGLCKYTSAGKNGITTSTTFTLYANRSKTPKSKHLFLSWAFFSSSVGAGLTSGAPTTPITNNKNFLFSLSMINCPFTNTKQRQGGQIYYGDYVQLTVQGEYGPLYFNPTYGNTDNPFTNAPGDCTTNSFQTLQILKVDSNGNLSVSNNDPVLMGDEIALVAVSSGVLNQPDGGQKGWVIQVTTASNGEHSANLTGPGMNFLLPQHSNKEHKYDLRLDSTSFGKEFKTVTDDTGWGYIIFTIFILFCLIILGVYAWERATKSLI